MSWLYPTHVKSKLQRFEAAIAESGEAHEQAQKVAGKIAASAVEDRKKIEATRREIRSRRDRRIERERHRADLPDQEPGLTAAVNALKLLERRH